MNDNKIDCQERNQQNHGLISDCNLEYRRSLCSSHIFGVQQQPRNMGVWVQQPNMDQGGSQIQHLGHGKPSTTIISRFESPSSAFYATERCMGFPQYEHCQGDYPPLASQTSSGTSEGHFPSGQSSGDICYSADQADPNFEFRTSLQPTVKQPQLCGFQSNRSFEKFNHIPCSSGQESNLFGHQQHKLHGDNTLPFRGNFSVPFIENQDHSVCIFLSSS